MTLQSQTEGPLTVDLDSIDADGAIRETREEAAAAVDAGDTRLGFLRKGALAGAGMMSGGAILGAFASTAVAAGSGAPPAKFGKGDIGILNYALTLEYLEAAFYKGATRAKLRLSKDASVFLKVTTRDEDAHVAFLKKALGSKAAKEPKFNFKGANRSPQKFLATAYVLENTGVHAYLGQVGNIKSPTYLKAAGSILPIEARHAAVAGLLLKPTIMDITPDGPFDTPYTAAKVLAAVGATKFI
ncbi:MAG: ferritin-like domain-containing protein, partial [Solirubrobacteraceae bacterium]